MKPIIHTLTLLLFTFVALWSSATAQTTTETTSMDYAYGNGNDDLALWGTGKKETYDVAIHINNPALVGTTIKGVTLYIPPTPAVTNLKVWMSKNLNVETIDGKKQNVADITTQDADTAQAFNETYIPFVHPYTLTSEGVYVGYTFTITAVGSDKYAANPLVVCYNTTPGGFYIHTTKKYLKWIDNSNFANLALQVRLDGVTANGAKVAPTTTAYVQTGKTSTISLPIVNYGANGVQSVDLIYTIDGKTLTQQTTLPSNQQMQGEFGKQTSIAMQLPALATDGVYPATVRINKVNGKDNPYANNEQTFSVDARAFLPQHRVVVEEFTGTWCSNCPRGYAAMKAMKRLHPQQFIGLAYHNKDSMQVMNGEDFPVVIEGYPNATIERGTVLDPYFGTDKTGTRPFYFETEWQAVAAQPALVDVAVTAKLTADGKRVEAQASVTSPRPESQANYHLEFVLVGNGLKGTGSGWDQENDYKDYPADAFPEPEFAPFLGTSSVVSGLVYDDVVLATTRLLGTDVPLPSTLQAYEAYHAEAAFSLPQVLATYTTDVTKQRPVSMNKQKLAVAALLIDNATGKVANAALTAVDASAYSTGIQLPTFTPTTSTPTHYYDLSGRQVQANQKGVFITNTGRKVVR